MALALVAGILYAEQAGSRNGSISGWSTAGGFSSGSVRISGFANGLAPGKSSWLFIKARNHSSRAVAITRIWVKATSGGEGCPARTLSISRFKGRKLVGAHRTWRLALPILMTASASDACQGARYPLIFIYRTGH